MIPLITYQQAKDHSRLTTEDARDVGEKIRHASEIIMDHLNLEEPPEEWILDDSPLTYLIPGNIQAAALLVFAELYEHREATAADVLTPTVVNLLHRYPVMA
jgi:hypothetical protein